MHYLKFVSLSYRHDLVLHCIVSNLSRVFAESQTIHIYADLPEMHASVSPQATISLTLIVTPYCPDIVICNESTNLVALLELTCPLPGFGLYSSFEGVVNRQRTSYLQIPFELEARQIRNSYLLQYH